MESRLINALVEEGLVDKSRAETVLFNNKNMESSLDSLLINNDFIGKEKLYEILESKFKIPRVSLDEVKIEEVVLKFLNKETVNNYCIMPFKLEGNKLYVAMNNPLNINIIDDISFMTNKEIIPFFEKKDRILFFIEYYYQKKIIEESIRDIKKKGSLVKYKEKVNSNNGQDEPVIKLTDTIINEAILRKASDVHLDPQQEGVLVRFRIDGILVNKMTIPKNIYPAVCARIKVKANLDISKKMIPQDGKLEYQYEKIYLDIRVATMPTLFGEKIVFRFLYRNDNLCDLDKIVICEEQKSKLKNILKNKSGLILVAAPTGSGKSTTLCALINEINCNDKNIVTIEDPIEYIIPGINQINVNYKAGLSFSTGLRSLLRLDPDVIMIGEIRDEETAKIAIKAGITGHLVLSTLHTNTTYEAAVRLIDMGVPDYLVADSIIAVISQRLLRKLCPKCKEAYYPSEKERHYLKIKPTDKIYRKTGCKHCDHIGYVGRVAAFELLTIDDKYKKVIKNTQSYLNKSKTEIYNSIDTLDNSIKDLIRKGITSIEEMTRVYYEEI
ncbi:type II secretion system protein E [Clostridium homopropionicum DSM 5847]|uniref:Type II secretion system protein E n=1 Tax=Clostridium homopropionicum DSM 5847 TaxID=1121318 RepID=A0A0L6ZDA4_9CLOT|nr:GspE/PulE family protein [Clostridium homopropionicum]KOA20961.1 type II secretion system protein E [Clostridium homopropionicum DSM 5847]SFG01048.1 type IV pilus assembly protein PilB [Clostridium homopropionicum]